MITPEGCVLEIRAETCPVCGEWKPSGKLFDAECWKRLPGRLQSACYAKLGAGFEEAYESAKEFLARPSSPFFRRLGKPNDQSRYARFGYRPK